MPLLPPDPLYIIRNCDNIGVYSLEHYIKSGCEERLLVGSKNGVVYVYNLKTIRVELSIGVGEGPILHLKHISDRLITQVKGGKYKIYNLTTKTDYSEHLSLETDYSGFCRLEVSTDGEVIYTPDKDAKIHMFNIYGDDLECLQYDDDDIKLGEIMCLKYIHMAENGYLIAGYESGWILLWDLSTSKCIGKLQMKECPLSIEYNLDREKGVIGNTSNTLQIFKIELNSYNLLHLKDVIIKNPGINKVISKNNKMLATAGWDGCVRIFSWASLKPLAVLNEHEKAVQDIAFSPLEVSMWNSKILSVASLDGSISLWDIFNNEKT